MLQLLEAEQCVVGKVLDLIAVQIQRSQLLQFGKSWDGSEGSVEQQKFFQCARQVVKCIRLDLADCA